MSEAKILSTEEALTQMENMFVSSGLTKDGQIKAKDKEKASTNEEHIEEEKKEELQDNVDVKQEAEEEKKEEYTDLEKDALEKGWDPSRSKSAKEWLDDLPLYTAIKEKNKELKQLKKTVDELKSLFEKKEKAEYDQTVAQLETQRKDAVAKNDYKSIQAIDEQKNKLAAPANVVHDAVLEFQDRNKEWLNGIGWKEKEMKDFVLRRDSDLMALKLPVDEHMEMLERDVKSKYRDYFDKNISTNDGVMHAVEKNSSTPIVKNSKRKYTINDLNPEQQKAAKGFVKYKVFDNDPQKCVQKYIDQLVESGELK